LTVSSQVKKEQAKEVEVSFNSTSDAPSTNEDVAEQQKDQQSSDSSSQKMKCDTPKVTISPEELKEKLVKSIWDAALANAIEKYLDFEKITKDEVVASVINKFYYNVFNKDETLFLLSQKIAKILDVDEVQLVLKYKDPKDLLLA